MSRICAAVLSVIILVCASSSLAAEKKKKAIDYNDFLKKLRKISLEVGRAETTVQYEDKKNEMESRFEQISDGIRVRYKIEIGNVTWEDGIATIITADKSDYIKGQQHPKLGGVVLWKCDSFDVIMSKDEAAKIKKRSILKIDAVVESKGSNPGSTNSSVDNGQLIYRQSVSGYGGSQGYLFSDDYSLSIGRKELDPRWDAE